VAVVFQKLGYRIYFRYKFLFVNSQIRSSDNYSARFFVGKLYEFRDRLNVDRIYKSATISLTKNGNVAIPATSIHVFFGLNSMYAAKTTH
jgi:hypothetical protein